MPAYALRYVFFGTRWGSNSSFALVNLTFTSFCPARVLLPCPDSDASQCQLGYPKVRRQEEAALATPPSAWVDRPHDNNFSTDSLEYLMRVARLAQLSTVSDSNTLAPPVQSDLQCLSLHKYGGRQDSDTAGYAGNLTAPDGKGEEKHRPDMQFPVLVPLWQIYVRERPLPIFLHTSFMTVAALLWPLQVHARSMYVTVSCTSLCPAQDKAYYCADLGSLCTILHHHSSYLLRSMMLSHMPPASHAWCSICWMACINTWLSITVQNTHRL